MVIPFAIVIISGVTSNACAANGAPVLPQPVITSSKIKRIPCLLQISRSLLRYPNGGTSVPVEPATGSTIHAAIFSQPIFIAILSRSSARYAPVSGCPLTKMFSGKSVCLNTIVSNLIMEKTPAEVRLLLIDPKRVELTPYNGIPHLLTPVVVETDQVVSLLKGLIREMLNRYRRMEEAGARNIESFNQKSFDKMPYLVVAVDELADLMMAASFDVEQSLCRLAQLGRATGIHLVIATQRPSVDVLTGLII